MPSKVQVIIPCFNSGDFLPEAISSVRNYRGDVDVRITVVNDGSTDVETLRLLDRISANDLQVIHQSNGGPAAARNTGVRNSQAEYLLFLDSDNKILPGFIDRGVQEFIKDAGIGVVYGNPKFIGASDNARFKPEEFDIHKIFLGNYIDMCSMIRRKTWEEVGAFDESRIIIGHEDWEYWIRAGSSEWKFKYVNETFYEYRIRTDSLLMQTSGDNNIDAVKRYVYLKHLDSFLNTYQSLFHIRQFWNKDSQQPLRTFFKNVYRNLPIQK
jgi:glycosyltransferase involved in cell wall biosynthesis